MPLQKNLTLIILAYLAVYIIWGSTYFFIKLSIQTIPPFYSLGFRFFLGGSLFFILSMILRNSREKVAFKQILTSAGLGVLLLIGGTGFVTSAETKVNSYLAALIIASTPMTVAFFDFIFFRKRPSFFVIAGIISGIGGVGFLLYTGHPIQTVFTPEVLMIVLALILWSLGTSLGHKLKTVQDTFLNSAVQMLAAGVCALGYAVLTNHSLAAIAPHFSALSILSVIYLAIFGSLGFVSYNYLVKHEPAIRVVTYAFINPVIALLLGFVVIGEKAVPLLGPGLSMIFLGLFLMFYGEQCVQGIGKICFNPKH